MAAKPLLVEAVCSNGRNCRTCRNEAGGAQFRANAALLFRVPPDWPACPFGRPWGYGAAQAPMVVFPRSATAEHVHRPPTPAQLAPAPSDWPTRGPALWADLHRTALAGHLTPEWLAAFRLRIGCGVCLRHWDAEVAAHPPDLSSAEAAWEWSVAAHNSVSKRIGKPLMTAQQALERWT